MAKVVNNKVEIIEICVASDDVHSAIWLLQLALSQNVACIVEFAMVPGIWLKFLFKKILENFEPAVYMLVDLDG